MKWGTLVAFHGNSFNVTFVAFSRLTWHCYAREKWWLSLSLSICHRMGHRSGVVHGVFARRNSRCLQFNGTLLLCLLEWTTCVYVCVDRLTSENIHYECDVHQHDINSTVVWICAKFLIGFVGVDVKIMAFSPALSHCSKIIILHNLNTYKHFELLSCSQSSWDKSDKPTHDERKNFHRKVVCEVRMSVELFL